MTGFGPVLSRRRFLASLAALSAGSALAGCGDAGVLPQPDVAAAGFGKGATGTVNLWVRAATQAASQPIVEAFNASHPTLKVQLTAIPDGQYVTKFATAIRGRNVPDLVDMDDINSTLLAYHEALTDITELAKALPYLDKLSPGHRNLATFNGRMYAVPYAADISVLYYNKALFSKAGLDPNAPPKTLDETLTAVRALNKIGGGVKGISFGGDSPGIMGFTALPCVWATGSRIFEGPLGNQHANVKNNEPLRRMLEFYHTVWAEGLATASSRTETGGTWGKDFVSGTVGIYPGNEGSIIAQGLTSAFAKNIGTAPLPGAGKGTSVFTGGDNIGIPRGAKNASGAWEYIQFALQPDQQVKLPATGYTPIREDVVTPEFRSKYPRTVAILEALPSGYAAKTLAYNTAVNQTSSPWFSMFTNAVFKGSVDAALSAAQGGFENAIIQADT